MAIIYLILLLGVIIFVHELGHFLFAKKAGIYCYEFSMGMGPKIYSFKRKNDETEYSLRLFPIGGFVKLAGEDDEDENEVDVPKDKLLTSKTFLQRFITMASGALFNFILAIILFFIIGLIHGSVDNKPIIGYLDEETQAYNSGLELGDLVLEIDNNKIKYWNDIYIYLETLKEKGNINLKVKSTSGNVKNIILSPTEVEDDNGNKNLLYGFGKVKIVKKGLFNAIKFSASEFVSTIRTMFNILGKLFTKKIPVGSLSGPVGIYSIVEQQKQSFISLIHLTALLSINIGFINLLPFPAFDGGRILFLIIEKIRKKPVNQKVESIIHATGLMLLFGLMIFITVKDVLNLFK